MTSDESAPRAGKPLMARMALACFLAVLATGCTGPGRQAEKLDARRVQQFEARGYPAPHQYAVDQTEELRVVQGRPMRLVWTRPRQAGPCPLVVYLPGAGQDARAFAPWRKALAEAGYVVLSWQPLPEDEQRPLGGDAHARAVERFSAGLLQQRGAMLAALMTDLARAHAAGEPALRGVDVARAALAGYELGAFTAQWSAGEHMTHVDDASAGLRAAFKAFVWFSPYASFSQGGFETRYGDLTSPVLVVTSDKDSDPSGLVSAAYLRTAPFGGMPAGRKFMLMFRGMAHDDLGGGDGPERRSGPDGEGGSHTGSFGDDGPGGGSVGGGGMGPGGGMGRMGGRGPGGGHGGPGGMGRGQDGERVSPTRQAMQRSALATVSIAFLDASLQGDVLARDWLSDQAGRWLAPVADLHAK